jgi:hypothetical protein
MGEVINSIYEGDFKRKDDDWSSFEGFVIQTSKQTIKIGISSGQSCCENSGYMISEDDTSMFLQSELLNITLTDTNMFVKEFEEEWIDYDSAMFVNIETNKGTFQIAVYNEHNGYYGHDVFIESNQLKEDTCL